METLLHLDFQAAGNLRIVSGLVSPFFGVQLAEMLLSWRFPPCPWGANALAVNTAG